MVELVDTLDLGSSAARCVGSTPSTRTTTLNKCWGFCFIAKFFLVEINLKKKNDTFGTISVQIAEADYQGRVDQKLVEYRKQASVKGFRAGKVPVGMIKNMVGEQMLVEEVYKVLSEELNGYIKENDLKIIGEPIPADDSSQGAIDWKTQTTFDFNFVIGLIPEFKVEVTDKVKVNRYAVDVNDKAISEYTENLRSQYSETQEIDAAEEGAFVGGTILAVGSEEEAKTTLVPMDKLTKKEKAKFAGSKIGDTVTFKPAKAFDEDAHIGHVLGLSKEEIGSVKGEYQVVVDKITKQIPSDLNPEFYAKLFGPGLINTEEEFKEKITEVLQGGYKRDVDALLYFDIQEKLLDKTKVSVSADFLKKWLVAANKGEITTETVEKDYDKYEREIKWSLIKNKVVAEHNISTTDEEIKANAFETLRAQYFGGMEITPEMQEPFDGFVDKYL